MNNDYILEQWDVNKLIPYDRNPVDHPDKDITKMSSILLEYGCRPPLLIKSNGQICDGHLRYLASKKLGWEQLPVIICDDWTEAQIKGYRITSRNTAQWASFDDELLQLEMEELEELDFDMELLGFDDGIELESDPIDNASPPEEFKEFDENTETQYCCPKCQYEWSGKPK